MLIAQNIDKIDTFSRRGRVCEVFCPTHFIEYIQKVNYGTIRKHSGASFSFLSTAPSIWPRTLEDWKICFNTFKLRHIWLHFLISLLTEVNIQCRFTTNLPVLFQNGTSPPPPPPNKQNTIVYDLYSLCLQGKNIRGQILLWWKNPDSCYIPVQLVCWLVHCSARLINVSVDFQVFLWFSYSTKVSFDEEAKWLQ